MAAVGAGPFLFLLLDEFSYPKFFDKFLVLKHTHRIFCPVSLIEVFHSGTWKFITIITESGFELFSLFAHSYDTAFASFCLIGINFKAARTSVFLPDITNAKPAIHPARCNQSCFHCFRVFVILRLHFIQLYCIFHFLIEKS